MTFQPLLLIATLAFTTPAPATEPQDSTSLQAKADAYARSLNDAEAFVMEVEDAVQMARDGIYGSLGRKSMSRLEKAKTQILALLDGRSSAAELRPEDRVALFNAQETIVSIIRSDEKNRMVCTREQKLGSRLPVTECLTVAEREARARNARSNTEDVMRNVCVLGEGNPCQK